MRLSTLLILAMAAAAVQADNLRNPAASASASASAATAEEEDNESRELQAGTTATGGRNVDANGNCINEPEQGGVNSQVFATRTNPNRSGRIYPAFNTETCIFEPKQCIDFKSMYDNALIYVRQVEAGIEASMLQGRDFQYDERKLVQAEEIVNLGSKPKNFQCWSSGPQGTCNSKGACCRRLNSAFVCDREQDGGIESFSTLPCICNDFTITPGGGVIRGFP